MSAPSWSFRTYFLPVLALAVAAACSDRQPPAGPDDAGTQPLFKGKPPPNPVDPDVETFNPKEGAQGESFSMTVTGSGFEKAAEVVFVLDGADVSTIATTTRSVGKAGTNLTADVDIGLDAVVSEGYKVFVELRGRRGIGAEKFQVKVKPQQDIPLDISFRNATTDGVKSDGGVYINELDGIDAVIVKGGELWFSARNSEARTVQVHLGLPITAGFPFDSDRMPDRDPAVGVQPWIVTQDSPGDGFHGPGHSMPLYVTWNAEGKSWSLNFGATCEAANGEHDQDDDFVEVVTTDTGWTVESASSSENGSAWFCTLEGRGKNRGWVTIGRFDTPFLMTLGRLGG